jgi:predicted DNA-binding protein (MmcQ/YjbR family)
MTMQEVLVKLRPICLGLASTDETVTFGNPTFRVRQRMFTVLEIYQGQLCLVVKVGKESLGVFLADPRFFRAPYLGQHGWVSLRLSHQKIDWVEVTELVQGSYELVIETMNRKSRGSKR